MWSQTDIADRPLIENDGPRAAERLFLAATQSAGVKTAFLKAALAQAGLLSDSKLRRFGASANTLPIKSACQKQSHLNENGAPLQTCLSHSPLTGQTEFRFLLDPFFDADPAERHTKSLSLAGQLTQALGHHRIMDRIAQKTNACTAGTLWLAGRFKPAQKPFRDGVAVYLNAEAFAGWGLVSVLSEFLPANAIRDRFLQGWLSTARPVCLAVEFGPQPSKPRMKLYLRMATVGPQHMLHELASGGGGSFGFDILQPQAAWPASGLTIGLSFDPRTGALDGIKVDFCLCPACRKAAQLKSPPEEQLLGAVPRAVHMLNAGKLALLGFGIAGKGQRMNAYFEPQL